MSIHLSFTYLANPLGHTSAVQGVFKDWLYKKWRMVKCVEFIKSEYAGNGLVHYQFGEIITVEPKLRVKKDRIKRCFKLPANNYDICQHMRILEIHAIDMRFFTLFLWVKTGKQTLMFYIKQETPHNSVS